MRVIPKAIQTMIETRKRGRNWLRVYDDSTGTRMGTPMDTPMDTPTGIPTVMNTLTNTLIGTRIPRVLHPKRMLECT